LPSKDKVEIASLGVSFFIFPGRKIGRFIIVSPGFGMKLNQEPPTTILMMRWITIHFWG
jgi:hypothetical protein